MRRKNRFLGICLCLHLIASGVVWGGLCVVQRGHNTMHREQIAIASLSVTEQTAKFQLLDNICELPLPELNEEHPLYFALYAVTGEPLRFWMYMISLLQETFA